MNSRDNLIRSGLLSIPLVMLDYWSAAADWRFEWVHRPMRLRIWNVRGGYLPMDHYPLLDWLIASALLFVALSSVKFAMKRVPSPR